MSSTSFIAVERGLQAPCVLLPSVGGHYRDSNWNQEDQPPVTNFESYGACQPLFHLSREYDQKYKSQVKHLSELKLRESITPFKERGEFAAGPISSMWSLGIVLATSKKLPEAVHRSIARRVHNIFRDMAKMDEKIKIGPHPFKQFEVWYTSSGYVIKYRLTFVEKHEMTSEPEQAKTQVLDHLKELARKSNEHWQCYDGEDLAEESKEDRLQWNNAMQEAHCERIGRLNKLDGY